MHCIEKTKVIAYREKVLKKKVLHTFQQLISAKNVDLIFKCDWQKFEPNRHIKTR